MDQLKDFLSNNGIALLSLILAPTLAWFFNRRKQTVEVKKVDAEGTNILITSSNELVSSWEKFASKMRTEYQDCIERSNKSDNRINMLTTYANRLERFSNSIKEILADVLNEIEKTNPDIAIENKKKLEEVTIEFKKE